MLQLGHRLLGLPHAFRCRIDLAADEVGVLPVDGDLEPWSGSGGRNPRFGRPLLLPSLLAGIEPVEHLGLPAYDGADGLFDGRVAVTLPKRSGRRPH